MVCWGGRGGTAAVDASSGVVVEMVAFFPKLFVPWTSKGTN